MLRAMPSTAHSPEGLSIHNAVNRAMRVLTFLGTRPQGASLLEISTSTGIPKPSLHRTLTAMRGRGYASQSEPGGPYLLGPTVLEAAFTFHAGLDLRRLLHPLAAKVRDHCCLTASGCYGKAQVTAPIVYSSPTRSGSRRRRGPRRRQPCSSSRGRGS